MVSFMEVIERALTGPLYSEKDFDLKVFVPKLREVVKKYEIKHDPENPIPSDDDLADRIFKAAVELYTNVGTYCIDTERIIKFTEAEIQEALVTKAVTVDHFTPMEPRLASEVAHGVVGISLLQGNKIVRRLLAKYEEDIPHAPKGAKYEECWDIQSKQPKTEYLELYQKIKQS